MPVMGTQLLPPIIDREAFGRTFWSFDRWLRGAISLHQPTHVAYEAPLLHAGASHQSSESVARLLLGLPAVCEMICHDLHREVCEAHLGSVRKWFCGTGRAKKHDVLARCYSLDWLPRDHNAADAAAVWAYASWDLKIGPDLSFRL